MFLFLFFNLTYNVADTDIHGYEYYNTRACFIYKYKKNICIPYP